MATIQVHIVSWNDFFKKEIKQTVSIKSTLGIGALKNKINQVNGMYIQDQFLDLPNNPQVELQDDRSLASYGIGAGSTVRLRRK